MNANALSPISVDAPEWSPLSGYPYNSHSPNGQRPLNGQAPPIANNIKLNTNTSNLIDTPPQSGHSSANSASTTDGPMQNGRPHNGNPSPPSSLARSSVGTVAGSVMDSKKYAMMEEALADHHRALLRYLAPSLRDSRNDPRQNRARDKLLRLSSGQFLELSTDVYDELMRRDDERRRGGPNQPGNPVPKYLLPRPNFHFKRNQARQKLSTLPPDRFQQLATDVYFELERRFPRFARSGSRADTIAERNSPSRNGFPPRGPSRGPPESRSVSREGFRPPMYGNAPPTPDLPRGMDNELGRPLPKMYQSNVMIPNKGMMVEDDSDADSMRPDVLRRNGTDPMAEEYKAQVQALELKVDELQMEMQEKENHLEKARSVPRELEATLEGERTQWNSLRDDLERKVKDAQALNNSLQAELAKVQSENSKVERDLKAQLDDVLERERTLEMDYTAELNEARRVGTETEEGLRTQLEEAVNQGTSRGFGDSGEWQTRCEGLERELAQQHQTTEEVRREASDFLREMRTLSRQSADAVEKEEKLRDQVVRLERDVREWKSRYAKSKSQARTLRSSIIGQPIANANAAEYIHRTAFTAPDGAIKDFHVTQYQLSIDELLQQARDSDSEALIESMKHVIVAVRQITSDLDALEHDGGDMSIKHIKLKTRVSHAANHLITTTKSHAAAAGIAPVSLVDAAASHLTTAVVDIVRALKIRPSSPSDLEDHQDFIQLSAKPAPLNSRGKSTFSESSHGSAHMRNASMSSNGYSTYSRYSSRYSSNTSPPQMSGEIKGLGINQAMGMLRENGIEEFKNYLEDTTAVLVRSIQPLVNTIRSAPSPDDPTIIADYTRDISMTVQDIVDKTNAAVVDLKDAALSKHAPPVIKALEGTCSALVGNHERGEIGAIPPAAFRIARATKELVLRVDRIESGDLTADMTLPFEF